MVSASSLDAKYPPRRAQNVVQTRSCLGRCHRCRFVSVRPGAFWRKIASESTP